MITTIYNGKIMEANKLAEFHLWFYDYCVREIHEMLTPECNKNLVNLLLED